MNTMLDLVKTPPYIPKKKQIYKIIIVHARIMHLLSLGNKFKKFVFKRIKKGELLIAFNVYVDCGWYRMICFRTVSNRKSIL